MNPETGGPTIGRLADGSYDFAQLSQKLYEIKQRIWQTQMDTDRIILQAEADIEYQSLITTMDAARKITIEEEHYELFPRVSISAGIL